jgi:hypothetical protein
MFTPVFTPARFSDAIGSQHFQQTIVPQALTRFAADFVRSIPESGHVRCMSAKGQKRTSLN